MNRLIFTLARGLAWGVGIRMGQDIYKSVFGDEVSPPKPDQQRVDERLAELEREIAALRKRQAEEASQE